MKQNRNKWKQILLACMCAAAFVCACIFLPGSGAAIARAEGEGTTYTYNAETEFTCGADGVIMAYNGDKAATQIIVPMTVGKTTVTGIGDGVFSGCEKAAVIAIPDTVVTFGTESFKDCTSMGTLFSYSAANQTDAGLLIPYTEQGKASLPTNLQSIGTAAFAGCTSIGKFAVADANAYFTTYAWNRTTDTQSQDASGTTVINPKNEGELLLSKDGTQLYRLAPAFHYTGQGLYSIPATVVTIQPYACERVSLNQGIQIPTSVQVIGDYAFYQCGNMDTPVFLEESQVTTIGAWAFAYNNNLRIQLPKSVTSIGIYSFAYCQNIQIDISKTSLTVIPDYAFYECDNLRQYYAEGETQTYEGASIAVPETLREVGAYVFYGCNNLNQVVFLGTTLDKIGTAAFQGCQNLHTVDIPEGVTEISDETFDGCQNLNTVLLPDSLTTIGDSAFKDCQNIHTMVIPPNVVHISNDSFTGANQNNIDTSKNQYCQKFIKAELPALSETFQVNNLKYKITKSDAKKGTVTVYGTKNKKLKTVSIPKTVMYKGYKFKVTSIAKSAFKNCKKLKTVKIGANVKSVGSKAFCNCTKLTKVSFGKNVKTIGSKAFYNCKKLKTVKLDANLKTIGNSAFAKCTALKKITIPSKVSTIGSKAFYGCKKLKTVTIKTGKIKNKKIGKKAFAKISTKATIKVPKKKLKSYKKILKTSGISKKIKVKKL